MTTVARKKLFYKIGEACKVLDIQPYVLRYWETEFPILSPGKSKSGQRVYTEKDLSITRRIKTLLYEEGYTIAGAKKRLEAELEANDGDLGPDRAAVSVQQPAKPEAAHKKSDEGLADSSGDDASAERDEIRQAVASVLNEARELLAFLDGTAKGS